MTNGPYHYADLYSYYNLVNDAFTSENTYSGALNRGGYSLLTDLIFYELFLAHCVELKREVDEENHVYYLHRIKPTIDQSLFNEIEQVIVNEMQKFISLDDVKKTHPKNLDFWVTIEL